MLTKSKTLMIAVVGATLIVAPVFAQPYDSEIKAQLAQKTQARFIKDNNRNVKLADAASINEDLIGFALDGKADKVAEKVAAMRKALPVLRSFLNDSIFETLGRQVMDMEKPSSKGDILGTALLAVEAYRTLENAMDVARRSSPIEVAMMDYSGFKLSILAAAQTTDWPTIAVTATEADSFWSALGKKIKDTSIRNLVGAIQDGLRSAVERKDIHGINFGAKMQLEVVDVLEQYFNGAYKTSKGLRAELRR